VTNNISNAKALMRVELEHASDEVLKVLGIVVSTLVLRLGMGLPE